LGIDFNTAILVARIFVSPEDSFKNFMTETKIVFPIFLFGLKFAASPRNILNNADIIP
jgi:hypothetical protein